MMDYTCVKFGDFSFSLCGFIVRTDTQNHRITDVDDRLSPVSTTELTARVDG